MKVMSKVFPSVVAVLSAVVSPNPLDSATGEAAAPPSVSQEAIVWVCWMEEGEWMWWNEWSAVAWWRSAAAGESEKENVNALNQCSDRRWW